MEINNCEYFRPLKCSNVILHSMKILLLLSHILKLCDAESQKKICPSISSRLSMSNRNNYIEISLLCTLLVYFCQTLWTIVSENSPRVSVHFKGHLCLAALVLANRYTEERPFHNPYFWKEIHYFCCPTIANTLQRAENINVGLFWALYCGEMALLWAYMKALPSAATTQQPPAIRETRGCTKTNSLTLKWANLTLLSVKIALFSCHILKLFLTTCEGEEKDKFGRRQYIEYNYDRGRWQFIEYKETFGEPDLLCILLAWDFIILCAIHVENLSLLRLNLIVFFVKICLSIWAMFKYVVWNPYIIIEAQHHCCLPSTLSPSVASATLINGVLYSALYVTEMTLYFCWYLKFKN